MCEICSKLAVITLKTPARHQRYRSGVFIVNFEQILLIVTVISLLTFNKYMPAE